MSLFQFINDHFDCFIHAHVCMKRALSLGLLGEGLESFVGDPSSDLFGIQGSFSSSKPILDFYFIGFHYASGLMYSYGKLLQCVKRQGS